MKDLTLNNRATIKEALKLMFKFGAKCLVIVNSKNILLGTLSDGDLRKAILKGAQLNENVDKFYFKKPFYFLKGKYNKILLKEKFISTKIDVIPIIDKNKKLIEVVRWEDFFQKNNKVKKILKNIPTVIMAGGKGTRMEPFTKVLPKPLIPIHDKPVIEHIIEKFTSVGINDFYLTVNYKSRILKAFFEEIKHSYKVKFIDESNPLGTAGSLQFLKNKFNKPFFVTNCDIIINTNIEDLYNFHISNSNDITLVASAKEYSIPYGTCQINSKGKLSKIVEKPKYDFLVNTGLYIINPKILKLIPKNKFYHITNLINDAKKSKMNIGVYPIDDDSWIDVGQWKDYKNAIDDLG